MSADRWVVCPKCARGAVEAVKDAYGKVSEGEYLSLLETKRNLEKDENPSLREDFYIGMREDGVLIIDYGCSCEDCDFSFNYKHEQKAL